MSWILVAAIALFVGLVLGYWLKRPTARTIRPTPEEPALVPTSEPQVPESVQDVLNVLRSSAMVIGPHDQVLQSTAQARTLGLVRGTRVAVPAVLDLVRRVREDKVIRSVDLELRRSKGAATLHLHSRVAPLGDLILVLAEDRTAARRVEETRRDFVANVSHELKTPIGAISLLSEAVEEAADDPEAVRQFASRMHKESGRLSELVGQIIELSRLQADDPLMAAEDVDVDDVIAGAVDRCRVDADRRGVQLTIAGQKGCRVLGDVEQLETAIANLVENAVIYSDEGAKVAVAARRTNDDDDSFVEITVSDNGIGISESEMQRIFERFYRVDYARSRANGGTGLGLSIVKHIAAAHGGQVTVWSRVGQGSTFTIRIPEHAAELEYAALGVGGLGDEIEQRELGTSPAPRTADSTRLSQNTSSESQEVRS